MKALRLSLLLLVLPGLADAQPVPGWRRVEVPATGSYFWRYLPQSVDASRPAPLVLFFHGAGGNPDAYRNFVSGAAENAGCVVAMPKSSGIGWGTATDEQTVVETLRLVGEELPVDDRRIAVAGHSAGDDACCVSDLDQRVAKRFLRNSEVEASMSGVHATDPH